MSNATPKTDAPTNATAPEKKIQMRKKTPKELEEMLTAISTNHKSCESTEENEPRPPTACMSETSMQKMKDQIKNVPMVKAFNKAENKISDNPK